MGAAQPNGDDYGTYRDQLLAQEQRAREIIKKTVIPQAAGRSSSTKTLTQNNVPNQPTLSNPLRTKIDGVAHLDIDGTTITLPVKAEVSYDPNDQRWHVTILPRQTKVNPDDWQHHTPPTDPTPTPPTIHRDEDGRRYLAKATKPRTRRPR